MIVSTPPKNCPRCRGLMLIEDDWYGKFGTCIACGYVHDSERCDPKDIEEEELLSESLNGVISLKQRPLDVPNGAIDIRV